MNHRVCCLVLLSACGGAAGSDQTSKVTIDTLPGGIIRTISHAPADSGMWHLVPARTIDPPDTSDDAIGDINDIALGENGVVYIVDGKPLRVRAFDTTGKVLHIFGREGAGPGEYRAAYLAVHGDTLAIQDPRAARAEFFLGSTGAYLSERRTVCCHYAPLGIDGNGYAVARTIVPSDSLHPTSAFARFSFDGKHIDTASVSIRPTADGKMWIVKDGDRMLFQMQVPLQPYDYVGADAVGNFLAGWTGEYLLRSTRSGSDTVSLFGRDWRPEPVSGAMKQQIVDAIIKTNKEFTPEPVLRTSFTVDAIPDQRPAFEKFWTDLAGRRWVRASTNDTSAVILDLFSADGRWLDQLHLSVNEFPFALGAPVAWGRDEVAVVVPGKDEHTTIVVYRITRK